MMYPHDIPIDGWFTPQYIPICWKSTRTRLASCIFTGRDQVQKFREHNLKQMPEPLKQYQLFGKVGFSYPIMDTWTNIHM